MTTTTRLLLGVILTLYFLLALGYGLAVPLFEAPDEQLHFFTVETILRERRLPVATLDSLARQEAAQPPLYYLLGALLVAEVNTTGAADHLWLNPLADLGNSRGDADAAPPLNVNAFVHSTDEAWPWRGYVLAAHLLRIFSAIIGLGTLLVIHAGGRLLWPQQPGHALLATALVAFLPQYAFLHGAITNDPLIIFFVTLALWQILTIVNCQFTIPTFKLLLLGFIIGLAMLSKTAGLLLLLFAAAYLGVLVWISEDWRIGRALRVVALITVPALAVAGWWLGRNWLLYQDITAASQFVALAGGERPFTLRQVWNELDRVLLSSVAYFGWMNVRAPAGVYAVWGAVGVAAVAGWLWNTVHSWPSRQASPPPTTTPNQAGLLALLTHPALLLAGWLILVFIGWLQFMLRTPADQGRLLFPALLPLTLALTAGLTRWPRPWTAVVIALLACFTSAYCLMAVIPSTYAPPPTTAALPAEATPLNVELIPGLELIGASVETAAVQPNEWAWVTLYWRATRPFPREEAPLIQLDLFGRDFHLAGRQIAYPGRGLYPPPLWIAGDLIVDQTAVRLYPWAEAPGRGRLAVSLVTAEAEPWPGTGNEGADIGEVKLAPSTWPELSATPLAQLGDHIALAGITITPTHAGPGETVHVSLRWQVSAAPETHLHTFVHLGDANQPPLAQHDSPPLNDEYPTWLWAAGEVIVEELSLVVPLDLPPGNYPIQVGMYDPATGLRLPLSVAGEPQVNDVYPAGMIAVE